MYFVYDMYGNHSLKATKKELRKLLLDEVFEHILNNLDNVDFVRSDIKTLEKIYNENDPINSDNSIFIRNELSHYGWFVIDVNDIREKLMDIRKYSDEIYDDTVKYVLKEID